MTKTDNMQTSTTQTTTPTGLGARLKAAREAMQISEKDAASRLHLSIKFIEVMETEDFDNGPPATFMRGYLRSYARMVNIPEKEINHAIEKLGMHAPETSTLISPLLHTRDINNNEQYIRWLTYLIILVLAVLVGIWWSSHSKEWMPSKNAAPTQPAAATPPEPAAITAPVSNINPQTTTPSTTTAVIPPVNSTAPATIAPTTISPTTPTTTQPIQPITEPLPTQAPGSASSSTPTPVAPEAIGPIQPPAADAAFLIKPQTEGDAPPVTHKTPRKKAISEMPMAVPEPGLEEDY